MSGRHVALAAPAAVALALAAYPAIASGYGVRATLQVFMWIVLAGSWNLISGLTGYVSFGHVAFFGAGAYAGAILMSKAGWPWLAAALVGGVAAVVLALVIGYPCLRLKGPYFAIAMLGLNEVRERSCRTSKVSPVAGTGCRYRRWTLRSRSTTSWGSPRSP